MKSGLIVYLVGGAQLPAGVDLATCCKELGLTADRVELVGSRQGFFEVDDAWHHLLTKGCGNIKLMVAQMEQEVLRPLQPPFRLSG